MPKVAQEHLMLRTLCQVIMTILFLIISSGYMFTETTAIADDRVKLTDNQGVLRVGFDARPRSIDPRFVSTDANSQYIEPLLFLPLFGFNEDNTPRSILAESYQFLDSKSLVVRLRRGVKFALGREITADDVVSTYQFVLGQSGLKLPPSPRQGSFDRLDTVYRVSSHEIRFQLREPDASLLSNLVIGILPKEAINQQPDQIFNQGFESGPFVFDHANDFEWSIKKNEKYSGLAELDPAPQLQRVAFKIFTDSQTRYAALIKGDIDLIQNSLDNDKVGEIIAKRADQFQVQLRTFDATAFLGFNFKNKFFSDVRVRRAIGLALNREEILRFTLQGMGQIANSMFPPDHAFSFKNKSPLSYNTREAELLLNAAGYPDPDGSQGPRHRAEFTLKVPLNRERIAVAKAIAGQLKKVGIKVKVEVLEYNTFLKHLNDGNIQAWIGNWTGYKDGDHLHFVFHSARVPPSGGNRGFYQNKELDRLLDQAKTERNTSERKTLYQKAQAILAEEIPYVFLWHRTGHVVSRQNVEGFKLYTDGRYSSLTVTKLKR